MLSSVTTRMLNEVQCCRFMDEGMIAHDVKVLQLSHDCTNADDNALTFQSWCQLMPMAQSSYPFITLGTSHLTLRELHCKKINMA